MKQPNSKSKLIRVLIWICGSLGGLVLVYIIVMNMMMAQMNNEVPTDLDYSSVRRLEQALFNVSYTASMGIVPVNQLHQWTRHIETADGRPVENATITVNSDMFHQLDNSTFRVAYLLFLPLPQHCHIQPILRHIKPHIAASAICFSFPYNESMPAQVFGLEDHSSAVGSPIK